MNYYINPKTQELIIVDLETNEISVAQRLELKTGEILEREPAKEIPEKLKKGSHSKRAIPEAKIQKIKRLYLEGMKRVVIAEETGVKLSTIYKYTSEAKKNEVKEVKEKKPMGKEPISPEIVQKIKEMVEKGIDPKQIAKDLKIGYTSVYKYAPGIKRIKVSQKQRDEMRKLRKGGMSCGKIAKEVGITKSQATFYTRDVKIESQKEEQESGHVEISEIAKNEKDRMTEKKKYTCLKEDCGRKFESFLGVQDAICTKCGSHNITE